MGKITSTTTVKSSHFTSDNYQQIQDFCIQEVGSVTEKIKRVKYSHKLLQLKKSAVNKNTYTVYGQ